MPKASTVTMRVDESLKRQAEALCEEMGLTLSTAYTMLLKAIVRTRSIPFALQASDPFYSEVNQACLRESIRELNAGHGMEHDLIDA
ncbi:MAG: type II toxin-antitoxin system RelB/DinJ family antitoxin [Fretibacterium sp.]|nr:type II toxin-antitoxin system RelB/DinJ family antitoxin [Fretibacterium sp.]